MSVIHHFNTNFLCSLKTFMSILLAIIPHEFFFYYSDYKLTLSKLELPILISKVKWCAFFGFLSVHKHVLFNSFLQLLTYRWKFSSQYHLNCFVLYKITRFVIFATIDLEHSCILYSTKLFASKCHKV